MSGNRKNFQVDQGSATQPFDESYVFQVVKRKLKKYESPDRTRTEENLDKIARNFMNQMFDLSEINRGIFSVKNNSSNDRLLREAQEEVLKKLLIKLKKDNYKVYKTIRFSGENNDTRLEFLGMGSFNFAFKYQRPDGSWGVIKQARDETDSNDASTKIAQPERISRIANRLSPELHVQERACILDGKQQTVLEVDFLGNINSPTELEQALAMLQVYDKDDRLILDAWVDGNVLVEQETNKILVVDWDQAVRRRSITSEEFARFTEDYYRHWSQDTGKIIESIFEVLKPVFFTGAGTQNAIDISGKQKREVLENGIKCLLKAFKNNPTPPDRDREQLRRIFHSADEYPTNKWFRSKKSRESLKRKFLLISSPVPTLKEQLRAILESAIQDKDVPKEVRQALQHFRNNDFEAIETMRNFKKGLYQFERLLSKSPGWWRVFGESKAFEKYKPQLVSM
jgi:hypothetical protein